MCKKENKMILGFTGTQRGMTEKQKNKVRDLFILLDVAELHHGDCIGADANAHDIFKCCRKQRIVLHPPSNPEKRAFCSGNASMPPLPYLDRNKNIVMATEALIATPGETEEQLRSGTWSTVRFARKLGRPIYLVLPDGSVKEENVITMDDPAFQ